MFLFLLVLLLFEWLSAKTIRLFFFEKYALKKVFIWTLAPFIISVLFGLMIIFVFKLDYEYVRYTLLFYTLSIYFTFSGYTHAFHLGLNLGNFKWSPSKLKYQNWWGIYAEKNNYLYVSRGIGTIGFMGRIGMYPEIVVITLKRK